MKLVDRVVCITLMSAAFSACLGSCRTRPKISGVEARLSRTIAQECHNQFPCVIAIKKATDFSWDTMYAFKPSAKQDEVQRVLGTTLDNFSEDARKLVFVNKGRVVLFENEPTNFEYPLANQPVLDIPDDSNYRAYSVDSTFQVNDKVSEDGPYYELHLK